MSSDVKDTCKEDCPLWKEYGCNCPYYMETVWINEKDNTPKILKDCCHKRSVTMLMDIHNQLTGIKQYASQTRSTLDKLCADTREFMAIQTNEQKVIENRTRNIENVTKKLVKNILEAKTIVKKIEAK